MGFKFNLLLTICIQTFNRSAYLEELLSSLPEDNSFQVLVGDFSTDAEHIRKNQIICSNWDNLVYFREEDQGLDAGFHRLILQSNSEYCWLMPDDDLVCWSEIRNICCALRSGAPDVLVLNSAVYNQKISKLIKGTVFDLDETEQELHSYNIRKYEHVLSYIGACIFKRCAWLKAVDPKNIGTYFNHAYVIGALLEKKRRVIILNIIATKIRANNALWTKHSFRIWTENWPRAICALRGRDEFVDKNMYSISTILYYHAYGALDLQNSELSINKYVRLTLQKINKTFFSMVVYFGVSVRRGSLVSEPGYYILKSNKCALSRFILRYFYND